MPIELLMPALSPTMTEGTLATWNKKEGDAIKSGDLLAEIETDKAIMEIESTENGTIGKILVKAGAKGVKINTIIALILKKGETVADLENFKPKLGFFHSESGDVKPAQNMEEVAKTAAPEATKSIQNIQKNDDRIFASPLAKRVAEQKGVNVCEIQGSGPHGRVIKSDVDSFSPSMQAAASSFGRNAIEYKDMQVSTMRSVIASRLLESKQNIPHFYLDADCNVDNLLKAREFINSQAPKKDGKPAYKVSVNDIIVKCTAIAIRNKPFVNCSWMKDAIRQYSNIDISVAVSIPDGLITPIVKNADQKGVLQISSEIKDLAARAKTGGLKPEEFQGGGFSISNLGMYGVKNFHAIVNPPQSCILAVGTTEEKPIVKNREISVANIMTISISVDHRSIDGAKAAEFLSELKAIIENPVLAIL